jgi:rod shape determining protein RodA
MLRWKTVDWSFVIVPLILTIVSIATIYTITYVTVGNKLAVSQLIYTIFGFGLLFAFTFFDYRHFKSMALILLIGGIILLIPLLPWWSHKLPFVVCEFNSCRWLNLGFFRFQSSELFKLITILVMSAYLSEYRSRLRWWHLGIFLTALAVPVWLILQQPDLGTSIVVLACGVGLLFVARFPWWTWVVLLVFALISAPIAWQNLKPYQKRRVEVFLNPNLDLNKTGYNVRQAEIAVGSGGIWGRGFGQGSQSQLNFLPVAHTDFIFAGYAEATGFVGGFFLIAVFAFLIWRAVRAAEISKDTFGRFIALGVAVMIAVQVLVNIGMNIRLMPVTVCIVWGDVIVY